MSVKPIDGVVFDWGGVIIDEPRRDIQKYCSTRLGLAEEPVGAALWKHLPLYQESKISERQLWEKVCSDCGQEPRVIPSSSLWGEALRAVFRFRKEVLDAIKQLRQNGYKVGFLSNTEPEAAGVFYERKMDKLFHASILSCEVGISKPDPQIYHLVAQRMEMPLETLLLLDDRQENIDGALQTGMQGARVSQTDEILKVLHSMLSN